MTFRGWLKNIRSGGLLSYEMNSETAGILSSDLGHVPSRGSGGEIQANRSEDAGDLDEPWKESALAEFAQRTEYATAEPFPHIVIDNLFRAKCLAQVLQEWPQLDTGRLIHHNDGTYSRDKYASTQHTRYGPGTRSLLRYLGEPVFLEVLEKVTGILGLIPDPYLRGGGLHFTRAGGKLAVHADFNKHFKYQLDRRLNLIVYLNHGWTDANRGWLELWDRKMTGFVKRILPMFNRTVVFSTTDFSYHGQPEPIEGPPDLFRKSIALYYYSNGRPQEEIAQRDPGATLWQKRPDLGY